MTTMQEAQRVTLKRLKEENEAFKGQLAESREANEELRRWVEEVRSRNAQLERCIVEKELMAEAVFDRIKAHAQSKRRV